MHSGHRNASDGATGGTDQLSVRVYELRTGVCDQHEECVDASGAEAIGAQRVQKLLGFPCHEEVDATEDGVRLQNDAADEVSGWPAAVAKVIPSRFLV
jgi:hypothetical protein